MFEEATAICIFHRVEGIFKLYLVADEDAQVTSLIQYCRFTSGALHLTRERNTKEGRKSRTRKRMGKEVVPELITTFTAEPDNICSQSDLLSLCFADYRGNLKTNSCPCTRRQVRRAREKRVASHG